MQCVCEKQSGRAVIKVNGRLDAASASEFEQECNKWIGEGGTYLILDLQELDYISSAGLRSILTTAKKLKATQGRIALCGLRDMVNEVITVSGFSSYIPIFPSLPEAVAESL